MSKTTFLNTLFSPLKIGLTPEMSSQELHFFLKQNLNPRDYNKVEDLKRTTDIDNIRAFWRKEELQPRGNLSEDMLAYALTNQEGLPSYILDYLEKYPNETERLNHFPYLLHEFYRQQILVSTGFIRRYLQMERDLRLIFTAFRSKILERDLIKELQYEDPEDSLIACILAQKDSPTFDPPEPYEGLKTLFHTRRHSAFDLHQAIEEWKFQYIEDIIENNTLSLDWTLAYLAQLEIAERWLELDKHKGLTTIELLVKEVT